MTEFRLFSLLFSYPSPDVLLSIERLGSDRAVSELESLNVLMSLDPADLQVEYTGLFVNSYPTLLCPPYESYYREGTVYGCTVNQVMAIYRQHGLAYMFQGEPPDHISVELDFLAETGDPAFLSRMREWVPQFAEAVKENSTVYGVFAREMEDLFSRC